MTSFVEGDLRISFDGVTCVRKFDDEDQGLPFRMKAVDFIVELDDRYLFIEFKSGRLVNEDLKYKYRDSFLYEWACGRADKPIYYYILASLRRLHAAHLVSKTDVLRRQLPLVGPHSKPWRRAFIRDCIVFNVAQWNKRFPEYPVAYLARN